MNDFGFKENDLKIIIDAIKKYPEIEKAVIFGSRATGKYNHGSDVDIAIFGEVQDVYFRLSGYLNDETPLPYYFDVIDYNNLNNTALKNQIDKDGVAIY